MDSSLVGEKDCLDCGRRRGDVLAEAAGTYIYSRQRRKLDTCTVLNNRPAARPQIHRAILRLVHADLSTRDDNYTPFHTCNMRGAIY